MVKVMIISHHNYDLLQAKKEGKKKSERMMLIWWSADNICCGVIKIKRKTKLYKMLQLGVGVARMCRARRLFSDYYYFGSAWLS